MSGDWQADTNVNSTLYSLAGLVCWSLMDKRKKTVLREGVLVKHCSTSKGNPQSPPTQPNQYWQELIQMSNVQQQQQRRRPCRLLSIELLRLSTTPV